MTLCGNDYGPNATALLKKLKLALEKFVVIQMKIDARKDIKKFTLRTRLSRKFTRRVSSMLSLASNLPAPSDEKLSDDDLSSSTSSLSNSVSNSSDETGKADSPVPLIKQMRRNLKRAGTFMIKSRSNSRRESLSSGISKG